MAKISALGEREIDRWEVGQRIYVLTQKADGKAGRLLSKLRSDDPTRFVVEQRACSRGDAERYVANARSRFERAMNPVRSA